MRTKLFEYELRNAPDGPVYKGWKAAPSRADANESILKTCPDTIIESVSDVTCRYLNDESLGRLNEDLLRAGWGHAERILIVGVVRSFLKSRPHYLIKFEGTDSEGRCVYIDEKAQRWKEYSPSSSAHPLLYAADDFDSVPYMFEELQDCTGRDYKIVDEF